MKNLAGAVLALIALLVGMLGTFTPTYASSTPLLAGEGTYGTIPTFLFGVNDSVNWDPNYGFDSPTVGPAIQAQIKAAHVPIARTWFFEKSLVDGHALSDAEQLAKLKAVQSAGMMCFAVLDTGNDQAYDFHVLDLLNGACPYVEVMNEPDQEDVTSAQYLAFWNRFVPAARAAHPGILFGGPALSNWQGNECDYTPTSTTCYLQKVLAGMASAGNAPDFVTYHEYPCWDQSAQSCMQTASTFSDDAQTVISWVKAAFPGKSIPVINSEWNADPGNPAYMNDPTWMGQYITTALHNLSTSGLAGAFFYDIGGYANWGTDDLFDVYNGGVAKGQFTSLVDAIAQARGVTPPTIPVQSPTATNTPTPTPTNTPTPTPTPTHSPTPKPTTTPGPTAHTFVHTVALSGSAGQARVLFTDHVHAGDVIVVNVSGSAQVTDSQGNVFQGGIGVFSTTVKRSGTDTTTVQVTIA